MVIIVFGLPGSGKSYFASRLARQLEAAYVSSDELRMKLIPRRTYTDDEKRMVYDQMVQAMSDALFDKKTVVLDATFYKKAIRARFDQAADEFNEKIIYIEVTAPENIIEERLKLPRTYSEADIEVYKKLKETAEPLSQPHLVLVSTNDNISPMLHDAIQYIETIR